MRGMYRTIKEGEEERERKRLRTTFGSVGMSGLDGRFLRLIGLDDELEEDSFGRRLPPPPPPPPFPPSTTPTTAAPAEDDRWPVG